MRILVVEDEPQLNKLTSERLTRESYSVDSCLDGEEAWEYLEMGSYDLILLDVMLPKINGIEIVRRLRAKEDLTPVLLLTALDAIEDRVKGLDAGADDYLVKPFAYEELLARMRVLIRRNGGKSSNVYQTQDLELHVDSRKVFRGGVEIELSAREFAILECLMRNEGNVLTREQIGNHVWNYDYEGSSNIIDVYIRSLRQKVDKGRECKLIQTVRGVGYRIGK